MLTKLLATLVLYCVSLSAAYALNMSSGTGFFVSLRGDLVTNAHVIEPCANQQHIYYRFHHSTPQKASLIAMDEEKDLALLRSSSRPSKAAALRWIHTTIQEKQKVFVIGYPQARTITEPYSTAYATIKALDGPFGEAQWLQFTDAARRGNSGGPLLDFGGNVVGVVTGKSKVMRINKLAARHELVDESDIAVTAKELKAFLDRHRIHYRQADSLLTLNQRRLEQLASQYVVHLFCATDSRDALRFNP